MGDIADQARDAEERMSDFVDDVLRRAGHITCPAAGSAEYTVDVNEQPIVVCGCYEVFSAEHPRGRMDGPPPERPDPQDEPPWEVGVTVPGTATEVVGGSGSEYAAMHALDRLARQLEHVDPTKVYTPELLEQNILDVVRRIDTGTLYEAELIGAAYATAHAYELAFAKALGRSEGGAAKDRQAAALVLCEDEYMAMVQAEMLKKVVAAAMHNLRASLSGYQSVLRSISASFPTGGHSGPNGRTN